jgi:hypothetical protein
MQVDETCHVPAEAERSSRSAAWKKVAEPIFPRSLFPSPEVRNREFQPFDKLRRLIVIQITRSYNVCRSRFVIDVENIMRGRDEVVGVTD